MHYLVGFIILAMIVNALGVWFWLLLFAIGAIWFAMWYMDESSLTDEEREQRRREKSEREHAEYLADLEEDRLRRQLEIQAEYERQQKKSSLLHSIGGAAAKVGVSMAFKALTGARHHHRH